MPGLKKSGGSRGGAAPPAGGVGGGRSPPHLQMVVILKIGLAWFFWVWLRSYYKKPQKKHRNAKTEPFKVSYCFEDRRTTLKIGLACLFGFGFVRDTKTYGRNNDMRNMILQAATWSSTSLCTLAALSKLVWLVCLGLASFVVQKPIEETPKCEN